MEEVRRKIRLEAVGAYGQNDYAKVKQIEDSLDEWLRILFQSAETLPEDEKDTPFVSFLGKTFGWFKEKTPGLPGNVPLTSREISKIPKLEEEGPLPGVEFPVETESDYQATLPKREKKERKIRDLFSWTKGNKRKYRSTMTPGIMTGH